MSVTLKRPSVLLGRLRKRALERKFPCDLTVDDIQTLVVPEFCPVLGVKLDNTRWSGPSFDRIVPELGYVRGNVRIISMRANSLRSNASVAELRLILEDAVALETHSAHDMIPGEPYQRPIRTPEEQARLAKSRYYRANRIRNAATRVHAAQVRAEQEAEEAKKEKKRKKRKAPVSTSRRRGYTRGYKKMLVLDVDSHWEWHNIPVILKG